MANKTAGMKNRPAQRKLREGEYYNSKTQRYEFRYKDSFDRVRVASSYKLLPSDRVPQGKKNGMSLREKEAEIQKTLEQELDIEGSRLEVFQVVRCYLDNLYITRRLSYNTKLAYERIYTVVKDSKFGHIKIINVKPAQCEALLKELEKSYSQGTLWLYIRLLKATCEYAVDNDWIRKNPFRNLHVRKDSTRKHALTPEQIQKFLDFCRGDKILKRYYDMFYIMFWTGVRASELCGITLNDVDMVNRTISINKQMLYIRNQGKQLISRTKTRSSVRIVPMTDGVYDCIRKIQEERNQGSDIIYTVPDENGNLYSDFLFSTPRAKRPVTLVDISGYMKRCVARYNIVHPEEPIECTPHICRHSFATNMQDLPIKTLQTILGHSDISTTVNNYVHERSIDEQRRQVNDMARAICEKNSSQDESHRDTSKYELFTNYS